MMQAHTCDAGLDILTTRPGGPPLVHPASQVPVLARMSASQAGAYLWGACLRGHELQLESGRVGVGILTATGASLAVGGDLFDP
jgi:hypothetical protein